MWKEVGLLEPRRLVTQLGNQADIGWRELESGQSPRQPPPCPSYLLLAPCSRARDPPECRATDLSLDPGRGGQTGGGSVWEGGRTAKARQESHPHDSLRLGARANLPTGSSRVRNPRDQGHWSPLLPTC